MRERQALLNRLKVGLVLGVEVALFKVRSPVIQKSILRDVLQDLEEV